MALNGPGEVSLSFFSWSLFTSTVDIFRISLIGIFSHLTLVMWQRPKCSCLYACLICISTQVLYFHLYIILYSALVNLYRYDNHTVVF